VQGRSRETSRGAALKKLCEISFHDLMLHQAIGKQKSRPGSGRYRNAVVTPLVL
jgi:hypothetical protein